MSPIPLGILAASGIQVSAAGAYDLLESYEFPTSTTADEINWTNLVSAYGADYQHLQIRGLTNATRTNGSMELYLTLNAVASYRYHRLIGNGSTLTSTSGSFSKSALGQTTTATYGSDNFTGIVMDFLDWNSTSKYKTIRHIIGSTGNDQFRLSSTLAQTTDAIDSISIDLDPTGYYFTAGTRWSLYGLKASA